MISINLDLDYFNHPKTKRLIGLLGKGAEVLPIRLWCYTARYYGEEGRLTGHSAEEIESIIEWWGESGTLINAMLKVGLLDKDGDTFRVHDWSDHEGHISALKERSKRMNEARWKKYLVPDEEKDSASSIGTPDRTPARTPHRTPVGTPPRTPHRTPAWTPDRTPPRTPVGSPESPPMDSHIITSLNGTIPTTTTTAGTAESTAPETDGGSGGSLAGNYNDLQEDPLQMWGKEGRVGWSVITDLIDLGRKYGKEALDEAIKISAHAGADKKSYRYVFGVLKKGVSEPKPTVTPEKPGLPSRFIQVFCSCGSVTTVLREHLEKAPAFSKIKCSAELGAPCTKEYEPDAILRAALGGKEAHFEKSTD